MRRRRGEIALGIGLGALVLVACNAIIGVEDVTNKTGSAGRDSGSNKPPGDDDDDDDIVPGDDDSGPKAPELPTLALGSQHTCARLLDGKVKCWGEARLGQLGDGADLDAATDPPIATRPKLVPGIEDAVSISAGANHTCVVRKDNRLTCWGFNFSGQLGTGDTLKRSSPVDITAAGEVLSVAGGSTATCVVHPDKTASCWGNNVNGQLGNGTKESTLVPVKVKDLTGVKSISIGTLHACAVVEPADVFCWGENSRGQVGNGSTDQALLPQKVTGLTDAVEVVTAASFSCARQKNGRIVCWGTNDKGQLGNGVASTNPNPSPILVASLTDAVSLGAGLQHTCAARATGEVQCWGEGDFGQIGSGRDAGTATVDTVVGINDARLVWGGSFRSCAVRAGGTAQCWGNNTDGILGDGTIERAYVPVNVLDFP